MAQEPDSATDIMTERVWQLALAFGQGTGTMLATRQSLRLAFSNYENPIRSFGDWDLRGMVVIEYARALGRAAAAHASMNGRCVIDVQDVEHALGVVRTNTLEPMSACPIT